MIEAWKVLGNPTRLKLIDLLKERAHTTSELCAHFQLSRYAIMQHLRVLENAGVVTPKRHSRYRYNYLNHEKLVVLRAAVLGDTAVNNQTGLLIEQATTFPLSATSLFDALTTGIGACWREHDDAPSAQLEPRLGGRFWRPAAHNDTDGVLLATVDQFAHSKLLGLFGSMGMDTAVSLIRLHLTPDSDQTHLQLTHYLIGSVDDAAQAAIRQRWQALLNGQLPQRRPNA